MKPQPQYKVMMKCLTGTWYLSGTSWIAHEQVITFCVEDNIIDAELALNDLRKGGSKHILRLWIEEA